MIQIPIFDAFQRSQRPLRPWSGDSACLHLCNEFCAATSLAWSTAAAVVSASGNLPYLPVRQRQITETHSTHLKKRHTETRTTPNFWSSDLQYVPRFTNHQEFLKKSPGAQSYDLERDRCRSPVVLRQRLLCELSVADPTATKTHTHTPEFAESDHSPVYL